MIVYAADHMASVKIMEIAAHPAKPFPGVSQDHLRRLKILTGGKHPAKLLRVDAHHHPYTVKLVHLDLRQEVSGIHKMHGVYLSLLLVGARRNQRHKRMFLMAGFSPQGRDRLFPAAHGSPLNMPLPRPGAAQIYHLKGFIVHIKAGAEHLFKPQCLFSPVDNTDTSRNHILLFKHRIGKHRLQIKNTILQHDLQCLHFLPGPKRGRQIRRFFFPRINPVGDIKQFAPHLSLFILHIQTALPKIPDSAGRIFHRKAVQKTQLFPLIYGWRKRYLPHPQKIMIRSLKKPLSIINMSHIAFRRHTDQVCTPFCMQLKYSVLFLIINCHSSPHLRTIFVLIVFIALPILPGYPFPYHYFMLQASPCTVFCNRQWHILKSLRSPLPAVHPHSAFFLSAHELSGRRHPDFRLPHTLSPV